MDTDQYWADQVGHLEIQIRDKLCTKGKLLILNVCLLNSYTDYIIILLNFIFTRLHG